jgi:intein/homing endonuclease
MNMYDRELYEYLFPKKELLLERKHPRDYLEDKDEKITSFLERDFPKEKVDSDLTMNLFINYKRIPIDLLKGKLFIFGISGAGKTSHEKHKTYVRKNNQIIYKELKDVNEGEETLTTDGGFHKVLKVIKHKINNNVKIRTKLGYEIIVTKDHSLLTCKDFEIIPIKAEDCKKGTPIPLLRKKMMDGNTTFDGYDLDYKLGWLCGFYVADGDYQEGNLRFTKENIDLIHWFLENYEIHISPYTKNNKTKQLRMHNTNISKFILKYFNTGSHNKRIPDWVFSSCFEFRKGFLSGYFDGDGYISEKKKRNYEMVSVSEDLINDLMKLFQTMGVVCNKKTTWKKTQDWKEKRKYFSINIICEYGYLEQILDLKHSFKRDRLQKSKQTSYIYSTFDKIYNFGNVLKEQTLKLNYYSRVIGDRQFASAIYNATSKQILCRHKLMEWLPKLQLETNEKVMNFLNLPIYWDEIEEIIDVPEELNGVDLEIENNHTFLGDGIFVHNSEGVGVILEELSLINYPFTAFDPAGDFTSIIQINPDLKVYHVSKIKGKERELAREAFEKGYQVVINMEGEIDIEVRRKCVLEYLTEIQQLCMKYKEKNQGLVHALVLDEVKDYIPSISSGTSARSPTLNLIRALIGWYATDGRKYGTTMICASQRPTYLETGITSQFQNYFLMRVESVDLEKYREFMKTDSGKVGTSQAQIMFRLMKAGEAWINLTGGQPKKVRFRRRISTHKGKTPSLTDSLSIFEKNRRRV